MSKLNWRKATLSTKRSLSTIDEDEYRGRDAASRWLERHAKPLKSKKPRRPTTSPERLA